MAAAIGGRAAVRGAACPCCNGCPLWRRLLQCVQGPTDCVTTPPPPDEKWICASVTCTTGEILAPGMVVLIDQFCYQVMPQTSANPPENRRITSTSPLTCTNGCNDPRCPQGELYWPGQPCSGAELNLWVCGVPPGCHVRGCIIVDGSSTPRRYADLPPGATLARFIDLGPPSPTCCDCLPPGSDPCLAVPRLGFEPQPGQWPGGIQGNCCCTLGINDEPTTTFHIRRWTVEQVHIRPSDPPDFSGRIFGEMIAENCTAPNEVTVRFHIDGLFRPPGGETLVGTSFPFATSCYRRCPGGWDVLIAQLLGVNLGFGGFPVLTTGAFNSSCSNEDRGGGVTIEVTRCFVDMTSCNQMRYSAEFVYRDVGSDITIITRFEYGASVEGPNPCGNPCSNSIIANGQVGFGDAEDAPGAPGGEGVGQDIRTFLP